MANGRAGNVYYVDTSGALDTNLSKMSICAIKYIGNTSGTASIKADSSSGVIVWQESGANNLSADYVEMRIDNPYVTVANGAVLIIYTEVE